METSSIEILIVDDEQGLLDLFEIWLGDTFNVTTVTTGEAVRSMLDESVDILILDWRLPDCSGEEIVAEINEKGLSPAIAVVTGAEPDLEELSTQVDIVLQKPIGREELRQSVESLLPSE